MRKIGRKVFTVVYHERQGWEWGSHVEKREDIIQSLREERWN